MDWLQGVLNTGLQGYQTYLGYNLDRRAMKTQASQPAIAPGSFERALAQQAMTPAVQAAPAAATGMDTRTLMIIGGVAIVGIVLLMKMKG